MVVNSPIRRYAPPLETYVVVLSKKLAMEDVKSLLPSSFMWIQSKFPFSSYPTMVASGVHSSRQATDVTSPLDSSCSDGFWRSIPSLFLSVERGVVAISSSNLVLRVDFDCLPSSPQLGYWKFPADRSLSVSKVCRYFFLVSVIVDVRHLHVLVLGFSCLEFVAP